MATAEEKYPDIYTERNEDTRKRQRTVPMQKFAINSADQKPFGRPEFDKLLGHWGATTDLPAALLAKDLVEAYPDSKVILVERDVENWYKSFSDSVIAGVEPLYVSLAAKANPSFLGQMARINDIITKYYFHVPEPRTQWLINNSEHFRDWRANARSTYLAHNEMVKRVTPHDRLLLFQLKDGWEPLCTFLGKPVPDVPFPRVNETAALLEKMNMCAGEAFRRSGVNLAKQTMPVALAVAVICLWWMLT